MSKLLVILIGVFIPVSVLFSQISPESIDQLDRKLLEREFKTRGTHAPVEGPPHEILPENPFKSAMGDIGDTPAWNWVRSFTGQGGADIQDIVVDGSDIYAYGTFSDSLEIGGTVVVSTGSRDVFVARISSFGTLVWLETLSSLPDENVRATYIALAPDGVVISGLLETDAISGGIVSATRTSGENIFLSHISSTGTVDWINIYEDESPEKVLVDKNNFTYLLSSFNLLQFDESGNKLWTATTGGAIRDFTIHDTTIWVCGALGDTATAVGDSVFNWDSEYGAMFFASLNTGGEFGYVEFMPTWINQPDRAEIFIESDNQGSLYFAAQTDEMHIRDSIYTIWPSRYLFMKVDTDTNLSWIKHENISRDFVIEDFLKSPDDKFYIYGYNYGDSIAFGNLKIFPEDPNIYFLVDFNTEGEFQTIREYETSLYVFYLGLSNTIYSVSYLDYDHWIHKKLLTGAESWKVQIWNNGGDASLYFTMDIDEYGNLYAQGFYRGTVNFFGTFIKGRGIFFMKFRNDGYVEWFKTMDNPEGYPFGIKVDRDGNVYAWGAYNDYIRLEGQEYHNADSDTDGRDIYLVKLDRDGQLKFVKQFDGKGIIYGWGGLDLTSENDIVMTGSFSDTLSLGAYTLVTGVEDYWDIFVTKISSSGNIVWARSYGGQYNDWGRSIATDSSGNVYITGAYRDSIVFDTVSFISKAGGAYDLFITKLDPNGNFLWARNGGPENYWLRGHAITTHQDQLFVQGLAWTAKGYMDNIQFGEQVFFSEFEYTNFLANYNIDGELNWVKLFKINNWSWPVYKIDTDPWGNIYAGGVFQDTMVVESNLIVGSGAEDFYILKYSTDGQLDWIKTSELSSKGELDLYSLAVFEEDIVLAGGTLINGRVNIGSELIRTASQASYAGLLGKDIIGCIMELSVQTTEEDFGQRNGSAVVSVTGGLAPYLYEWSTGDTGTATIDSIFAGTYQVSVVDSKGCEQFEVFSVNIKNGPVITLEEIGQVKCHGEADGFININVAGGQEPYTYYWDNGYTAQDLTNLSAAPYSVTVTDANGLHASADFLVEQPKPLDVSYTIKQAGCNGGSDGAIEVFTSGGTKPYDWEWKRGFLTQSIVNAPAGKYSLTVLDNNNCKLSIEIALSEKDAPIVETEYIEAATCSIPDGAARVKVINSLGDINYLWSDSSGTTDREILGQRAHDYFVIVTNNAGCKTIHLVDIPEKKPLDNPICLVTVDTVIGSNLIVWEKVEEAVSYHIYRETYAKDVYLLAGTTLSTDLSVFVDTVANPLIRSYRYKIAAVDECGNESFLSQLHKTVHMTISPGLTENIVNIRWDDYVGENFESFEVWRYTSLYGWELLGNLPGNLRSFTDFSVPPGVVFYNVRVPFDNLCSPTGNVTKAGTGPYRHSLSNMDNNKLRGTTGLKSQIYDKFYVYPNPTDGRIIVWSEDFNIINGEILITDLTGRLVIHKKFKQNLSGRLELDLSEQAAGTYLVQLRRGGQVYFQKLLKQ